MKCFKHFYEFPSWSCQKSFTLIGQRLLNNRRNESTFLSVKINYYSKFLSLGITCATMRGNWIMFLRSHGCTVHMIMSVTGLCVESSYAKSWIHLHLLPHVAFKKRTPSTRSLLFVCLSKVSKVPKQLALLAFCVCSFSWIAFH